MTAVVTPSLALSAPAGRLADQVRANSEPATQEGPDYEWTTAVLAPTAVEPKTWPIENGGVCGSTRRIELDHVKGFALGAGTTAAECRLLCRPHQLVSARRLYGDDLMGRYVGRKGGGCSEPVASYGPVGLDVDAWTSARALVGARRGGCGAPPAPLR